MVPCILTYLFLLPPPTLCFASTSFLLLFLEQPLPPHELWALSRARGSRKDSSINIKKDSSINNKKIFPLTLKKLNTGPYFSHYMLFLCSFWHFAVKYIGFFRVWLQVTQGKNMFCKLSSCIGHRYQVVTALFTAELDCGWLNCKVQLAGAVQFSLFPPYID